LPFAFDLAEVIEFCAEIHYRSKCIGEPVIISASEMEAVAEKLTWYARRTEDEGLGALIWSTGEGNEGTDERGTSENNR
jgi:hypothetical protein